MLSETIDHLSIWEIAHRWFDHDPEHGGRPPLETQDLLREITYRQMLHDLPICTNRGIELKNDRTAPNFESFIIPESMMWREYDSTDKHGGPLTVHEAYEDPELDLSEDDRRDRWVEFKQNWCRQHDEMAEGLEEVYRGRSYNREKLESIHLLRHHVLELCQQLKRALPEFWFNEKERLDFGQYGNIVEEWHHPDLPDIKGRLIQSTIDEFWSKLADKQRHRLVARHIASLLWAEDPEITIADISRHEAMREWACTKYYGDKDTVRNWIKEIDPRSPEQKAKPKSSN